MTNVIRPSRKGQHPEAAVRISANGSVYINSLLSQKLPPSDHHRYNVEVTTGDKPRLRIVPDPEGYQSFRQQGVSRHFACRPLVPLLPSAALNVPLPAKVLADGTIEARLPS